MRNDADYDHLRRQIERDAQAEKERRARLLFRLNLFLYLGFLLFVWVRLFPILDGFWSNPAAMSLVIMSVVGGVGVLIHWNAYRLDTSRGARALREQLIGRAMYDSMDADADKPKRHTRLSEDGELRDRVDDEAGESGDDYTQRRS